MLDDLACPSQGSGGSGEPRDAWPRGQTTASSACQRKPTRILSDTNARHFTLALRGMWVSSSRRLLLTQLPCASTSIPTAPCRHGPHTYHTRLARSSPPLLLLPNHLLPVPVIKCTWGLLIQSPLALARCSTLLLLLSHAFSPRYSTLFSYIY